MNSTMPATDLPPPKVIARVAAGNCLFMAAGHASESLDRFASWFLAAFGAGLALSVSHLKEVSTLIPLPRVELAAYLFLVATILCVVQRYIAMVVTTGAKAAKDGREMGEKLKDMDVEEFLAQMLLGLPWPVRHMSIKQFSALSKGDFAAGGRMFMRLTMWQGALVGFELILLLVALTKIVNEIGA